MAAAPKITAKIMVLLRNVLTMSAMFDIIIIM